MNNTALRAGAQSASHSTSRVTIFPAQGFKQGIFHLPKVRFPQKSRVKVRIRES